MSAKDWRHTVRIPVAKSKWERQTKDEFIRINKTPNSHTDNEIKMLPLFGSALRNNIQTQSAKLSNFRFSEIISFYYYVGLRVSAFTIPWRRADILCRLSRYSAHDSCSHILECAPLEMKRKKKKMLFAKQWNVYNGIHLMLVWWWGRMYAGK